MIKDMKNKALDLMETIIESELSSKTPSLKSSTYNDQKQLIKNLFSSPIKGHTEDSVMLRLTVIDSLYSTSAAFSHFAMEQMTEKILSLGSEEEAKAYFYAIACGGQDSQNLFNDTYGYQRNKPDGVMQMSLLSKYASFSLLEEPGKYPLGFPIYDNLAKDAYKPLCQALRITPRNIGNENSEKITIEKYVAAFNEVREILFGKEKTLYHSKKTTFAIQQYDLLDTYLWRMGKIGDGSYSYLFGNEDYKRFIQTLGLEKEKEEKVSVYFARIKELYKTYNIPQSFDDLVAYLCAEEIKKGNNPFKCCKKSEMSRYMNKLWQARQTLEAEAKNGLKEIATAKKAGKKG